MAMYDDLDDAQLATEIAAFRAARRNILIGDGSGVGAVKRITDEGRTLEYTSANLDALDRELRALLAEQARREDPYGRGAGRAIEVEFE